MNSNGLGASPPNEDTDSEDDQQVYAGAFNNQDMYSFYAQQAPFITHQEKSLIAIQVDNDQSLHCLQVLKHKNYEDNEINNLKGLFEVQDEQ